MNEWMVGWWMDDSISVTQYLQYFAVSYIDHHQFRFTMPYLVSMKRYGSISHNITYLTKFDMNL